MSRNLLGMLILGVLLAACAPMTPGYAPQSASAPRIEGSADKAVIYIVRTRPDLSYLTAPIVFDETMLGSTYAGTYFRVETTPGRHRISGYSADNGAMTLDVQAGHIYYIQHAVSGSWRATNPHSFFSVMDERRARAALAYAVPAG